MISATQLRVGMVIKENGGLHRVMYVHHATPGNKRGFIQAKLRNLDSGLQKEMRYASSDKVEKAHLDHRQMEYLYQDQDEFFFMDMQNHEQISLGRDKVGDIDSYLSPNQSVVVVFFEGKAMSCELPKSVDLTVTSTVPGLKTATVTSSTKPATLETGLVVQVPQFVKQGDIVRIDTTNNAYIERVKN
ncbi:MAG: elongation factor P [Deltaproteobacteria bacterium RIFCSPHIGHO2_02_FULL_40_11]|nr:MAG: elongation factor P [Deltaproteobacteria bacterium RIFCSPHIGHO2_02_FULL_40_11]